LYTTVFALPVMQAALVPHAGVARPATNRMSVSCAGLTTFAKAPVVRRSVLRRRKPSAYERHAFHADAAGLISCATYSRADGPASGQDSERPAAELLAEGDRLYAARQQLDAARRAADLYAAALARDPQNFEAAWKLARAGYWLGGHVTDDAIRAECERGMAGARAAIRLAPQRPEGHFWLAATMGRLAESQGLRAGLRYRSRIRESLQQVLAIDPAFQQGSADRALGRWYFKVPRLFGGSRSKAEAHLRKALTYNPRSTATHFFLAELYLSDDRDAEARAALQAVLDAPIDPAWEPEDLEFKARAREALARLGG
jgi:hypothetical protein